MLGVRWSVGDVFKVLALSFISCVALIILLSLLFIPVIGIIGVETPFFLILSSFHILLLIFTAYYLKRRGCSFRDVGLTIVKLKYVVAGILLGAALLIVSAAMSYLTEPIFGSSMIQESLMELTEMPELLPPLLIFGALIAPIIEELYFRGFAYLAFKSRFGTRMGIFISALFFAVMHLDIPVFIEILVIGIILTYAYEKTKSLPLVIIAHIFNNALALYPLLNLQP